MTTQTPTSSRRAAPPKRLSLITPTHSFNISSPPPLSSSSFTSSPRQQRDTPRRSSSISYTGYGRFSISRHSTVQKPMESTSEPPTASVATEPLTLVDRHASLLFEIAEKESRCLDLRTQLSQQERELAALKQRWERVLIASSPTTHIKQTPSFSASFTSTNRHSISEESMTSSSDSCQSVTTPNDENPTLSPSPARVALPGSLGLSMMYKEMQAGIVKSDKLKRASLFLNDMFSTALGSPVPHPSESPPTSADYFSNHSVPPQVCRLESKDSMVKPVSASNLSHRVHLRRHTTTSLLDDDEDVPHFSQILAPDTIRTSPPLQPVPVAAMVAKASSTKSRIDDDDEEWNW